MAMWQSIVGGILNLWLKYRFRYALLVSGVRTGPTDWLFQFDYANAMDEPVILEEAILRFTFANGEGAWIPVARSRSFTQNRLYGPKEKRDPHEHGYIGVKVRSKDIEFPEDMMILSRQPGAVHKILSQTNKAEISLRVRVGSQIHQTAWYEYKDYGVSHKNAVKNSIANSLARALARQHGKP
jgi:hypothetical protein